MNQYRYKQINKNPTRKYEDVTIWYVDNKEKLLKYGELQNNNIPIKDEESQHVKRTIYSNQWNPPKKGG